ncbi:UNVERIFIED_ORG: hypothetical protein QE448_000269 [Rhizobium sp. SORGH_AS285]|nr:hypothetical protein [Rhizobium sp. SORGH_AS_0285]
MSALAFIVAVASSAHGDERIGRTITSFMPLSAEPPLLMISIDASSRMVDLIAASRRFSVAALSRGQEEIADVFAGLRETCRIGFRSASGIPGLQEALGLPGRYSPLIASSSAPLMPPTTSCSLAPSPNRSRIPHAKPCSGAIAPIPAERRGASDPGFLPTTSDTQRLSEGFNTPRSGESPAVNHGICNLVEHSQRRNTCRGRFMTESSGILPSGRR